MHLVNFRIASFRFFSQRTFILELELARGSCEKCPIASQSSLPSVQNESLVFFINTRKCSSCLWCSTPTFEKPFQEPSETKDSNLSKSPPNKLPIMQLGLECIRHTWDSRVVLDQRSTACASAARGFWQLTRQRQLETMHAPPVSTAPTEQQSTKAMQRLAIQKGKDKDVARFDRLRKVLGAKKNSGGADGRADSPPAEKLGYFPPNIDPKKSDVAKTMKNSLALCHIIDIPRMCPLIPLFQPKRSRDVREDSLHLNDPPSTASSCVPGINDLVTPFFVVFLRRIHIPQHVESELLMSPQLPREQIELVEADSFWCVSSLLPTRSKTAHTFAQPGIQRKDLFISSFGRKSRATIRLWDTYLAEQSSFSQFHSYVCAAFLRAWSKQLQAERDFQGIMILLQNLPTQSWGDREICELTADAYSLQAVFDGAARHLTSGQSSP
ncbi:unnamed protein product, partial [Mesorhabditis belari]|uniref:Uncharacterized protein n=1 Tax=Mesorhabditis belari TaxID=2138241 RepID=A0AAF3EGH3_9BILA